MSPDSERPNFIEAVPPVLANSAKRLLICPSRNVPLLTHGPLLVQALRHLLAPLLQSLYTEYQMGHMFRTLAEDDVSNTIPPDNSGPHPLWNLLTQLGGEAQFRIQGSPIVDGQG